MRRENLSISVIILLVLLATPWPASAKIIYVDDDAAGANNGSSWQNAYKYLQNALAGANSLEKPVEIHVAQGIYKPDQGANQTAGDRMATFQLKDGVILKGGYAGAGAPDPNARNINAYESILSGDLVDNDAPINDPYEFVDYEDPSRTDNSFRVVTSKIADPDVLFEGFVVTAAYAHEPEIAAAAGLFLSFNANINVRNCAFTANAASGIMSNGSNSTIVDCTFRDNIATWYGGGMDICYGGGRPHLIRCTFEDNWAMEGGGLYNRYGILWLEDCTFTRNIACGMGCMDAGYGGGLYSNGSPAGSIVKNCTFIDNIAGCGGGAHFGEIPGGPIREAPPGRGAKVLLTDCTFIGNQATFGGAIHMDTEVLDIKDSVFRENSALFGGGAISNLHSITNLDHCIFLGNSASREGACIYVLGSRSFVQGQEWIKEFVLTVNSCTFAGNLAPTDQAIACKSYNSQDFDSAIISNCILDNGGNQIYNPYGSKITIAYTNLRDETSSLYDPCNAVIWGEGNIDVDPCFVDPGYWADPNDPNKAIDPSEPNVIWIDGDYHLKSQAGRWNPKTQAWVVDDVTSPCIDAGDPASPIGEEPFPNGGRINMGAYGGTAEASKSYFGKPPCETIIAGDINGDCNIDFVDFQILAYHWLEDDSP